MLHARDKQLLNDVADLFSDPSCCFCGKTACELYGELRAVIDDYYGEPGHTPNEYAREDGTYNPSTNHFSCDECYIQHGSPVALQGWKAP